MLKNILSFLGNSGRAILKGEFLLRLGIGKYFGHILYVFFLLALTIWLSLMMDSTMNKVEQRKAIINDLEIKYTMKKFELEKVNDRRVIDENLKKLGSELEEPDSPIYKIQ